jgi:hypothetical protein
MYTQITEMIDLTNPSQLTDGSLYSVAIAGAVTTPKANATTKRNTVFIICVVIIILSYSLDYFYLQDRFVLHWKKKMF